MKKGRKKSLVKCSICNGEGRDISGLACDNCHGLGYGIEPPKLRRREMMNDKYVTSLELSKRLKELKVLQESEFWWILERYSDAEPIWILRHKDTKEFERLCILHNQEHCSAHLSDELLKRLSERYFIYKNTCDENTIGYGIGEMEEDGNPIYHHKFFERNLPNALAKMLIYLLENKIVNLEV